MVSHNKIGLIIILLGCIILSYGGDLVSTWISKLEAHAEDVTYLVKNVTNHIVANNKRNYANDATIRRVAANDLMVASVAA